MIIVSHDRYLLDETVTSIAEMEDGRLGLYQGNYSAYAVEKQLRLLRQQQLYQAQQKEIARIEPTNNLDLPSCEVLERALDDFEGTVLAISHDRYLLNRVAERIVELEGGVLEEYRGDYTYYREEKVRRAAQRALRQTRTVKGMSPQKGRLASDNKKKH